MDCRHHHLNVRKETITRVERGAATLVVVVVVAAVVMYILVLGDPLDKEGQVAVQADKADSLHHKEAGATKNSELKTNLMKNSID
jgi:hypothetical protein